jgi:hypothetical protein
VRDPVEKLLEGMACRLKEYKRFEYVKQEGRKYYAEGMASTHFLPFPCPLNYYSSGR